MMRYTTWTLAVALAMGLLAGPTFAGKGGNGGGGTPGGGGEEPPADPEIAYVEYGRTDDLVVRDAAGASQSLDLPVDASDPNWSPDGQQIVFRGGSGASTNALYVVNADGTGLTQIVQDPYAAEPAWSPQPAPDGDYKIAFRMPGAAGPPSDIWLVNPDGSELQQLTFTGEIGEGHPTWDSTGTRLAVRYTERDATTGVNLNVVVRILYLGAGSQRPVEVVAADDRIVLPWDPEVEHLQELDWARTQDLLLCRSSNKAPTAARETDVWILDLDAPTTEPFLLTYGVGGSTYSPRWSPDDSLVLCEVDTGSKNSSGLYVLNPDGTGLTSLDVKSGHQPDWRR